MICERRFLAGLHPEVATTTSVTVLGPSLDTSDCAKRPTALFFNINCLGLLDTASVLGGNSFVHLVGICPVSNARFIRAGPVCGQYN